ncbi:hypothetical protein VTJ49DRAFT_329 [Mycothermus thermophilus]|uniref:Uncharacterized protein n=1 Tax=Humicola insolens TaxID=85995 RepID=A0ABR3VFB1_HUMIN
MATTPLSPPLLYPPPESLTYDPDPDPDSDPEPQRGRNRHRLADEYDNVNKDHILLFLSRAASNQHHPGSTESSTFRGRPRHRSSSPFFFSSFLATPAFPTPKCGTPAPGATGQAVQTTVPTAGAVPVPVPVPAIFLLRAAAVCAADVGGAEKTREPLPGKGMGRRRRRRSASPSRSRSPAARRVEEAAAGGATTADSGSDGSEAEGVGREWGGARSVGRRVAGPGYDDDDDDDDDDEESGVDTNGRRGSRRRQRTRSRGGGHRLC